MHPSTMLPTKEKPLACWPTERRKWWRISSAVQWLWPEHWTDVTYSVRKENLFLSLLWLLLFIIILRVIDIRRRSVCALGTIAIRGRGRWQLLREGPWDRR